MVVPKPFGKILSKGVKATASDISDILLKEGHAAGYIDIFDQVCDAK